MPPGPDWRAMKHGAGILWHNSADQQLQIWTLEGWRIKDRLPIVSEDSKVAMRVGPPWEVIGVGDFDRDGGADADHSDSDWMSFVVTIGNAVTKSQRTFQVAPRLIAASARTGSSFGGANTSLLTVDANDIVTLSCLVVNLGSSRAEHQFAQAVKVTDQVVTMAAPAIGAAISLFFGGNLTEGLEIGK